MSAAMKMEFICKKEDADTPENQPKNTMMEETEDDDSTMEHERPDTPSMQTTEEEEPESVQDDKMPDLSDHEDSEDEQVEHAPWDEVEIHPAIDMVNKVITACLDAGKTYNKSITAKTTQLITGCDNVLLEIKNLSDAREASRKRNGKAGSSGASDGDCACGMAMSMLTGFSKADKSSDRASNSDNKKKSNAKKLPVDEFTEDQTDRVLFRLEASIERLRELAELIQATSMQGEANLISKVKLPENAIKNMSASIQAAAAQATATAIAHERGRTSSAFKQLYSPLQAKKLQEWYYSYPRPLTDELTLMRTILNYRPFANPFQVHGLTIAHVRDWFKRRRYRERMRYVKLAIEAGRDAVAAEEEIDLRIEQRIEHLRATVDPNDLVKELDKVRAESVHYDGVVATFTRPDKMDTYMTASHTLPTFAEQMMSNGRATKRARTQDMDLDDALVVKVGNQVEVAALQRRIQGLLQLPKSATTTNAMQQVLDILRSLDISKDVRIRTGLVADLKHILHIYTKSTLLRKSTIALLESLGMARRSPAEDDFYDDEPKPEEVSTSYPSLQTPASTTELHVQPPAPMPLPPQPRQRGKREKGKVSRPMKFSMKQVMALEAWFQQKYKPTQNEMEDYLRELNTPPLRDEKQSVDVNMTQLRRWFNKRRCLRRPPFALMTQQDAVKEGSKNPASLKAAGDEDEEMLMEEEGGLTTAHGQHAASMDETNEDDSSDDDDDDDDDDSSDEE